MGKYYLFLKKSLKTKFAYHATMWFTLISTLLSFYIRINLWMALIKTGNGGSSLSEMVTYILINELILNITRANLTSVIESSINDGSMAIHLLRPISYKWYLFYDILGQNIAKFVTNVLPILVIAVLFYQISLPKSFVEFLLFIAAVIIGMFIMFEINFIVGLLAFWIQKCWFLRWYVNAGLTFFGGTVVPLWFYPQVLQKLSFYLPFRFITYEPVNIYLGRISLQNEIASLGIGVVWIVILVLIEKFMWSLALKKFTVNGG